MAGAQLLARYVRHATEFGGLREVWTSACRDPELQARELGELAVVLRGIPPQDHRRGGNGRLIFTDEFLLNRREAAALVARLIDAGLDDLAIRRYGDLSQAEVGAARRNRVSTPGSGPISRPKDGDLSVTELGTPSNGSSSANRRPRSPDSRACAWCSRPLPSTLRADARYCPGGACKVAAYRARRGARSGMMESSSTSGPALLAQPGP
jgi:hypothetical protein